MIPSNSLPTWAPQLATFLRRTDEAQAVIWDDNQTEISVATLGHVDEQKLRATLEATLNAASEPHPGQDEAVDGLRFRRLPEQHLLEKEETGEALATVWSWRRRKRAPSRSGCVIVGMCMRRAWMP